MAARRDYPRKYQVEVADRALKENVIAVSDTGSGKTLISVMLLKNMVAQARQEAKETGCQRKVAFFIVNKVPLVFQQHAYILNNSDIKAEAICGAMGVDNFNEDRWNSIFEEFEAVVITGQILLNILIHAFLKIDLCNILIFDECHHATGKHPYRQIMTEFYPEAKEPPKIFGMTASPPKDTGTEKFAATQLEETMDSVIITASYDEVLEYTQPPQERVIRYRGVRNGTGPVDPDDIEREFSRLSANERHSCEELIMTLQGDPKLKPAILWYHYSITELGPWFGAWSWRHILETLKEDIQNTDGPKRESRLSTIQNAEQIAQSMVRSRLDISLVQVTEKVQKLVEILREVGNQPGFCGILFVERRPAVHTMKDFLDQCKRFGPEFGLDFIESAVLTGHGSKGDLKQHYMNIKTQRKILEGFRTGRFNLLVATDVAEEGLDVDRCRIVIRFDVKNTVISHIQSRGRARDPNSEYIIMLPDQDGYLEKIKKKEAEMRQWCGELPEDRVIRLGGVDDNDDEGNNFGLEEMRELANVETSFIVESTGARVTFDNAISLLHQYCASLPADAYTILKPEFTITTESFLGGNYYCELKLPLNALAIDFVAGPFSNKVLAKRAVSFKAIKEIYRLGGLTDRLLPYRRKKVTEDQFDDLDNEDSEDAGLRGSLHTYPIYQPIFWANKIKVIPGSDSIMLYASLFSFRQPVVGANNGSADLGFRSLCLLTAEPLPQFEPIELFFDGKSRVADLTSLSTCVQVPAQRVQHLYQYHKLLFATVFHKSVDIGSLETGIRHLIAPLQRFHTGSDLHKDLSLDQLIDWAEVESGSMSFSRKTRATATLELQETDLSWDRLQDAVLIEKGQENRFYFPVALRTDLTPNSTMPAKSTFKTSKSDTVEAGVTFVQYYRTKREKDIQNLDQPLIEVKKVPRRVDHLHTIKNTPSGINPNAARFLIPELSQKCPVSASVLRSAECMVSVLIRVDDLLKTTEFLSEFGLQDQVRLPLMLEALTATDTSYAMNYQRLELLGDTFLKFMMTIDLFIRFPLLDEGRLTMKRTAQISNSHLFKRATRFGLDRFLVKLPPVLVHFFVPATGVVPPPSGEDYDQPQLPRRKSQVHQEISAKTMADLVESTLGAAYLSQGFELGLRAAAALLKPLEGIQSWGDFAKAFANNNTNNNGSSEPYMCPFKEDLLLGDLDTVEASVGYRFKNRRLLVEALTHATANEPQTPCYQRLEFLGDSILDMLVADYWVRRYPVSGPGVLHDIKSASINNQILGVLCIQLGLHRNILHFSSSLQADILRATQQVQDAKEDARETGPMTARGEPVGEYWHEFNITKVLGDVLESVFGAVFVDSGWDYSVVEGLFERAVLPTLRDHISIETLKKNPIVQLFHRIQREGCQAFRLKNLTATPAEEQQQPTTQSSSSSSSTSSSVPSAIGSPIFSASSTPLTTASSVTTPRQPPATKALAGSYYYKLRQGHQEALEQTCAVMIHDHPAVTSTSIHIQVARKEVAKRALALFDTDPEWLTTLCTCDNSTTRAKKARYEESSPLDTVAPLAVSVECL